MPTREICFDQFHVANHLGDAVNDVRKQEHSELTKEGDDTLEGSRYLWLNNPENIKPKQHVLVESLKNLTLKVAKAWAMEETCRHLGDYVSRSWARTDWDRLLACSTGCRVLGCPRWSRSARCSGAISGES